MHIIALTAFLTGFAHADPITAIDEPILCVDTIDCGGFCGTESQVDDFLAHCNKKDNKANPAGPCFSTCWNTCLHAAENSHSPKLKACTLQCMVKDCPGPAEQSGLQSIVDEVCPIPDATAICFLIFDPVTCGDNECSYSNQCSANAAGYQPSECTGVDPVIVPL